MISLMLAYKQLGAAKVPAGVILMRMKLNGNLMVRLPYGPGIQKMSGRLDFYLVLNRICSFLNPHTLFRHREI